EHWARERPCPLAHRRSARPLEGEDQEGSARQGQNARHLALPQEPRAHPGFAAADLPRGNALYRQAVDQSRGRLRAARGAEALREGSTARFQRRRRRGRRPGKGRRMNEPELRTPQIVRLSLIDFYLIEREDIELSGNTVFLGPNRSGKSSCV